MPTITQTTHDPYRRQQQNLGMLQQIGGAISAVGGVVGQTLQYKQQQAQLELQKQQEARMQEQINQGVATQLISFGLQTGNRDLMEKGFSQYTVAGKKVFSEEDALHMTAMIKNDMQDNNAGQAALLLAMQGKIKDPKTGEVKKGTDEELLGLTTSVVAAYNGPTEPIMRLGEQVLGKQNYRDFLQKQKVNFEREQSLVQERINKANIPPMMKKYMNASLENWYQGTLLKAEGDYLGQKSSIPKNIMDGFYTTKALLKYYDLGKDINKLSANEIDLIGSIEKKELEKLDVEIATKTSLGEKYEAQTTKIKKDKEKLKGLKSKSEDDLLKTKDEILNKLSKVNEPSMAEIIASFKGIDVEDVSKEDIEERKKVLQQRLDNVNKELESRGQEGKEDKPVKNKDGSITFKGKTYFKDPKTDEWTIK
ncbi:hypothetical protein KY345_04850 [Candidatus Woesearchaeota archaeon]|nr:hypothetical protein [Candidatus Woesearchaeota archaeon]